jgi:hypothetical protein
VNLEELDQIIERSTRAPLSESEGQKLKTADWVKAIRPEPWMGRAQRLEGEHPATAAA